VAESRKVRIERSVIRRSVDDPRLAEGERTLVELDPAEITAMLTEARRVIASLEQLFNRAPRRRQRRRLR
jgi:hypothetical protein